MVTGEFLSHEIYREAEETDRNNSNAELHVNVHHSLELDNYLVFGRGYLCGMKCDVPDISAGKVEFLSSTEMSTMSAPTWAAMPSTSISSAAAAGQRARIGHRMASRRVRMGWSGVNIER